MDAKRQGLRNVKKQYCRGMDLRDPGQRAAGNIGKSTGLGFRLADLALSLALPLSVALP